MCTCNTTDGYFGRTESIFISNNNNNNNDHKTKIARPATSTFIQCVEWKHYLPLHHNKIAAALQRFMYFYYTDLKNHNFFRFVLVFFDIDFDFEIEIADVNAGQSNNVKGEDQIDFLLC